MGGYSLHTDQQWLLSFVTRMRARLKIRLMHSDKPARSALADALRERYVARAAMWTPCCRALMRIERAEPLPFFCGNASIRSETLLLSRVSLGRKETGLPLP